jgi:hypothetical protein
MGRDRPTPSAFATTGLFSSGATTGTSGKDRGVLMADLKGSYLIFRNQEFITKNGNFGKHEKE